MGTILLEQMLHRLHDGVPVELHVKQERKLFGHLPEVGGVFVVNLGFNGQRNGLFVDRRAR